MLRFLSQEEVEEIHDEQLAEYGGLPGVKSYTQLGASVAAPRWVSIYESSDIHRVAAAYLYGFARDHCFEDANKRTGVAATHLFLWLNGHILLAPPSDLRDKAIAAATGAVSRSELAEWLLSVIRAMRPAQSLAGHSGDLMSIAG